MEDRDSMMGPRDVAEAILLCATLPQRTVIEQIVMTRRTYATSLTTSLRWRA